MMRLLPLLPLALLAACQSEPEASNGSMAVPMNSTDTTPPSNETSVMTEAPALIPPAPGEVGGLPDDRTPIAEGEINPKGPQGAASVLEQWGQAMERREFAAAWALSSTASYARQQGEAAFTQFWSKYSEIHVLIGAPGMMEGAAGSSFVEVPVQIYGRTVDGKTFNLRGPAVLHRVNDVDGATPEQLQWRIESTDLKPMGVVKEAPPAG